MENEVAIESNIGLENNEEDILQIVSFVIGNELFGVHIVRVQEIIRLTDITRVPNTQDYIIGVINLRGKVIPIIDLQLKLAEKKSVYDKDSRIVVVEKDNRSIGLIVDKVNEVSRISKSITEAPPVMISGMNAEYFTSIAKLENDLLILLDLDKVMLSEKELLSMN